VRPPGLDDLARQVAIGQVALSPDGSQVAYTRRTVVGGRDRIALWLVPWEGGAPRPLTEGPSDTTPRFSPDGTRLAFLSSRTPEESSQVCVVELARGLPWRLTEFPHGASDLWWTPDGAGLVVSAADEHGAGEVAAEGGATAHVIERIDWRDDDDPNVPRRTTHLHLVGLDGAAPRRLTAGSWTAWRPRVAADGTVLFLADPRADGDLDPCAQVHRVGPGEEITAVTSLPGGVVRFAPLADGSLICLGFPVARPRDDEPLAAFRVVPGRAAVPLTEGLDRWCGQVGTDTDLHDWHSDLDDGGWVTGVADGGCVVPTRLVPPPAGGPEPRPLEDGPSPVVDPAERPVAGAIAAAGDRAVAVMTLGAAVHAPEVYALEPGAPRRLTRHGSAWLEDLSLPAVEVIEVDGPAGPIQTVLVHPLGDAPEPRAAILLPHGGPTAQWEVVPPIEAVLLAAAGYRVALPNIRGSYDRGRAWVAPLSGAWGDVDAADCHAVLDHLVAAGLADPARLGVNGLSYGGFLVNWLIATSERFAAAVSENGVVNQVSAWANSDCGAVYCRDAGLGDAVSAEGVDLLWRQSPLRFVERIRTPLLMLQAADDLRCPAADAEQLFIALRWLRRTVRYVLYPGEHHGFHGSGRFDRRLDRHRRVLDWFAEHMPA
jgi:dipeptidyl aminopeptidase/acylaminoacyl peptidase